jgi:acetyl esterase
VAFDWLNGDVTELRRQYERAFGAAPNDLGSWKTVACADGDLRLWVQRPRKLGLANHAIIYFHGGGWIVGSPLTHADISAALADRTGMTVFSVNYRLAPEFPAPAPVIDGCRTLSAVLSQEVERAKIEGVILCGDSAGAAIAPAVEVQAAEAIRPHIHGVASFYGCFGLCDSASIREFGSRGDGLDAACIQRLWTLANDPRMPSPYSIEALGRPSGAPVYLLAAGHDPLRDDTLALVSAYRRHGRPHDLDLVEGETHGFLHDFGRSAAATEAIGRVSAWIRSRCAPPLATSASVCPAGRTAARG